MLGMDYLLVYVSLEVNAVIIPALPRTGLSRRGTSVPKWD